MTNSNMVTAAVAEKINQSLAPASQAAAGPEVDAAAITGFFDGIEGMDVVGWCFDQTAPARILKVDVLCDGVPVARTLADKYREDLAKAGIGDGSHHFRVRLPKRLADGAAHSITVVESGSKKLLNGGEKVLQAAAAEENPQSKDPKQAAALLAQAEEKKTEKKWPQAETLVKKAIALDPANAKAYFLLGHVVEKIGRLWEAADAYRKAIYLDPRHASWHYAYGQIQEKRKELGSAAEAYRHAIALRGDISERYYRLGHVLEQLDERDEAETAYEYAVELDDTGNGRRYGIGAYHAARGLWAEAARAYEKILPTSQHKAELLYRIGTARDQLYDWPAAIAAYREALSLDATNPVWHYQLGTTLERAEDWQGAAQAYEAAVMRHEDGNPEWRYRLGYVLNRAGMDVDACVAFRQTLPIGRTPGLNDAKYAEDKGFQLVAKYTEYFETLALTDRTVMYESFHGSSLSCNPYAIFMALLASPEHAGWTHIWVVNDKSRIPEWLKSRQDVIFVARGCDLYLRYLTTTRYLVNKVTFPEYFMRKPEQMYLNTWHGTPWKTLGKDNLGQFFEHKNSTRNFLHTTHLISPNPHTTEVLVDRYDIRGVYQGVMVETGYPRIDLTLNITEARKDELRKLVGVSKKDKVILYAPTWRGTNTGVKFDLDRLVGDLKHMNDAGGVVLFRGHHMVEKLLKDTKIDANVVPSDIDTNELLGIVDVLVTDYSSIFFDFIPTQKPIIHYVYDYEQYAAERGLYLPLEDMPGQICKDIIGVKLAVRKSLTAGWAPSPRYLAAQERFCPADDGHATARVLDMLFKDSYDVNVAAGDGALPVLFYTGAFIPNGITTSFLNLCQNIDRKRYRPVVILDPKNMASNPERIEQFGKVKESIQSLGRCGRMNITAEERRLIDEFIFSYDLPNEEAWNICARAYEREFIRMFGYTKFESLVNFEGYSQFWAAVIAFAPQASANSRSIYLHNDMHGEWRVRFAYLESVLRIYDRHDSLISVTESINQENAENLGEAFSIDNAKFKYCDNTLVPQNIRALALESLPENRPAWLGDQECKVFASMGRLSTEKDHRKLVDAFSEINQMYPETRLMIIGDGPLRYELETQIAELGLTDVVALAGQHVNPFPLLKLADCFVLSSNHEGQGMVLLEALTLGVPAMSTDIPGPQSVLRDGKGLLVENSVAGLVDGMNRFLVGEVKFNGFDAEEYQRRSIEMFYRNVCKMH